MSLDPTQVSYKLSSSDANKNQMHAIIWTMNIYMHKTLSILMSPTSIFKLFIHSLI